MHQLSIVEVFIKCEKPDFDSTYVTAIDVSLILTGKKLAIEDVHLTK